MGNRFWGNDIDGELKDKWKKGKKTHKSYLDVTKLKAIETKRGSLFEVSLP